MKKSIFFYAALVAVALCNVSCSSSDDDDDPITDTTVLIPEPETASQAFAFEIPTASQPESTTGEKLKAVNITESAKAVLKIGTTDGDKFLTFDSKFDASTNTYNLSKDGKAAGTIKKLGSSAAAPQRRAQIVIGNVVITLNFEMTNGSGATTTVNFPQQTVNNAVAPSNPQPAAGSNLSNIARTWIVSEMAMTLDGDVDCTVLEAGSNLIELAKKAQENDAQLEMDEYKELCRSILGLTIDKSGQFSIEYKNASGRVEYFKKPGDKVTYIECDGRVETEACTWNWASSDQQSIKIDTRDGDFGNKFLSDKSTIGVKFYTSGIAHLVIYTKITGSKNYNAYVDFTLK
jgi:hypothetical protein